MEYHRYGQTAKRVGHRAFVLTGTVTLFSYGALLDVRRQRREGSLLPRGRSFYDTHSLTEDNELTFAPLAVSTLFEGVSQVPPRRQGRLGRRRPRHRR
ncbi:hypothetical protein ACQPZJ_21100 [Actinoplanes sp. CA-054009]